MSIIEFILGWNSDILTYNPLPLSCSFILVSIIFWVSIFGIISVGGNCEPGYLYCTRWWIVLKWAFIIGVIDGMINVIWSQIVKLSRGD